ncbi:MAG: serine hydrolase [Microgenomates group bacterium]
MNKYLLLIFIGLISFFAGYYVTKKTNTPIIENRLNANYQFINPLLECDVNAISRNTNLDKLRIKLEQQFGDNTSIYYRDMNNGPWFGIHEKEYFSPASLIKVPLMMAYLKKAESDTTLLSQEILNTSVYDPSTQNIQPKATLVPNQKYTIKQLIEQMIIYSDDISFNLLNKELSVKEIIQVYNDLGVDISKAQNDPNGNIITVKSYSSFFRILFNASYLNPQMSEYALSILSKSDFKDGLVASLPQNVTIAHKFGERQYLDTGLKQLHDCGIVYLPHKPYLLCVMTRGDNFDTLKNNIKNISQTVYDYLSENP